MTHDAIDMGSYVFDPSVDYLIDTGHAQREYVTVDYDPQRDTYTFYEAIGHGNDIWQIVVRDGVALSVGTIEKGMKPHDAGCDCDGKLCAQDVWAVARADYDRVAAFVYRPPEVWLG